MITETFNKSTNSQETKVQYQGRKASRAGSEQRRKQILEASLRIIVREGLRGVRHRSVAKEANVPLAATTYYFKDIGELITDTFTHYVELALGRVALLRGQPVSYEMKATATATVKPEVNSQAAPLPETTVPQDNTAAVVETKKEVVFDIEAISTPEDLTELLSRFIENELMSGKDLLIAAQAFRHEALLNAHLRPMAQQHDQAFLIELKNLLEKAGIEDTKLGSEILFNTMIRVQYEALLNNLSGDALKEQAYNAISARMSLLPKASV